MHRNIGVRPSLRASSPRAPGGTVMEKGKGEGVLALTSHKFKYAMYFQKKPNFGRKYIKNNKRASNTQETLILFIHGPD